MDSELRVIPRPQHSLDLSRGARLDVQRRWESEYRAVSFRPDDRLDLDEYRDLPETLLARPQQLAYLPGGH